MNTTQADAAFESAARRLLAGRDPSEFADWDALQAQAAAETGWSLCPHCCDYGVHTSMARCQECGRDPLGPRCEQCDDTGECWYVVGDRSESSLCRCDAGDALREHDYERHLEGMALAEREAECEDDRRANWGRY